MDTPEAAAAEILRQRIMENGHDPLDVKAVRKSSVAFLCTATFPGDRSEYHAVVTQDEVDATR